jgi:hypothetical protein
MPDPANSPTAFDLQTQGTYILWTSGESSYRPSKALALTLELQPRVSRSCSIIMRSPLIKRSVSPPWSIPSSLTLTSPLDLVHLAVRDPGWPLTSLSLTLPFLRSRLSLAKVLFLVNRYAAEGILVYVSSRYTMSA